MKDRLLTLALFVLWMPAMAIGQAHFGPGVANIRDYAIPKPGIYAAVYNYGYKNFYSDRQQRNQDQPDFCRQYSRQPES